MAQKILIVDDMETDRKITTRFLKKAGYTDIIEAVTGEEGVEKATAEKPDLVITDTNMPGIDGFETCRQIRDNGDADNPKIIVTTGNINAVDAIKAKKNGADDYCVKATDPAQLMESVKNLIGEAENG